MPAFAASSMSSSVARPVRSSVCTSTDGAIARASVCAAARHAIPWSVNFAA
jgi:hypothetical protein